MHVCSVFHAVHHTRMLWSLLAGVEDPGMLPAVATIALQLAGALQEGIPYGTLFENGFCSVAQYSTKPWPCPDLSTLSTAAQLGIDTWKEAWWCSWRC